MVPRFVLSAGAVRSLVLTGLFAALALAVLHFAPHSLAALPTLPGWPGLATVHRLTRQVDPAVVLIFVPLCALMLAIVFEATRLSYRGAMPETPRRPASPPSGEDAAD